MAGSPSSATSTHTGTRHRCAARAGTNTTPARVAKSRAAPSAPPDSTSSTTPPDIPVTIGITRRTDHRPHHSPAGTTGTDANTTTATTTATHRRNTGPPRLSTTPATPRTRP